ncbi:hypothetical protein TL18_04720 [Methanobrevibacter sp. YE315]|uniref:hypothetical protein n=1 Tax=Methanobrevibacter sp. YE315 TaxID=1609968 RepID=UPI000764D650|nr:hypothetical protein [Methanobrevibacter sp. YE315]AMD17381.1 hypothetical protein TL18_04720 [Methanobrevibacter sp. YE315]
MNIEERILQLNFEHTGKKADINDLLLTLISKFQLFEPCIYLSEDDEWLNVAIISVENEEVSQSMSILKKELTAFGVFNKEDIQIDLPQKGSEDLYQ